MIAAYLDHLRVERRLAANTLESYARDLSALTAYADEAHLQPEALDRASLEEFVRRQMTRGLSPRSVARLVAAVRGFYRFLVLDRRLDRNPADDLRPPRAWPALPKFLSLEDVDKLIAQPDATTPRGLRDRAMIELLYATGLRVTELVGVRLADLHLDEHYLTCIGKGSKERLVPIGDEASEWIAKYQATARRALLKGRTTPRLFVNARGGPLSRVGFWKILKHHGRTAGLQRTRAPSLVRHTSARTGRGLARHPVDARARRSFHDTDLYTRARGAAADSVRSLSSASLI
jgi:integrase/recombinase XerD